MQHFFTKNNKLNSFITQKGFTKNRKISLPQIKKSPQKSKRNHLLEQMKTSQQRFWQFSQNQSFKQQLYEQQNYYPIEQNYFAEQLFQITPRYIPTSYGQVYSLTAGSPGQPLILVVHGSGPRNSSNQYVYLLHQYLVRISYIEKFYIIAIDCPGYGKSIGSKEAVKTFPKQLFQQILQSLKYKQYFAMLGHSQGGAAIFNAVYENPSLSQFLIMDRPVCGNIQRFRKFNIPTLLIYDIEDDGHPIWQGKLLYKQLTYSQFFTFRNSQDTYWVPDNIWDKMLNFFSKYSSNRKGRKNIFSNFRTVSMSPSIKQKSVEKPNKKQVQKKIQKEKKLQKNVLQKRNQRKKQKSSSISIQKPRKTHSLSSHKNRFFEQQKIPSQKMKIQHLQEVEQLELQRQQLLSVYSQTLSDAERQKLKLIQEEMKQKQEELLKDQRPIIVGQFNGYKIREDVIIQDIKRQKDESLKKVQEKSELRLKQQKQKNSDIKDNDQQSDLKCSICLSIYYRPLQTNCNHIFCTKCLLESLLVNPRCPLCRTNITKKTQKTQLHQQILAKLTKQEANKRQKAYLKLKLMLDSVVYIQIGNRCVQLETKKSHFTKTKKKYMWQLFANQKTTFKFQQVSFDVNMGDPNSKPVRVRNGPFVFESRGTFSFSCEITIKPKNKQYAPITSVYRINLQPGIHKQVIAFKKKIYLKG